MFEMCILLKKKKKNVKPSLVHKESIIFKHIQIYPQSVTKSNAILQSAQKTT